MAIDLTDEDYEEAAWLYLCAQGTLATPETLFATKEYIKTRRPDVARALADYMAEAKDVIILSS